MNKRICYYVSGLTFNRLKRELIQGKRLEDPSYAPQPIATLCRTCWNEQPEKRPTFSNIIDYMAHNFKITQDVTEKVAREPNSCNLSYAKLNFHETKIRKQFEVIQKSLPLHQFKFNDDEEDDNVQKTYSRTDVNPCNTVSRPTNEPHSGQSTQPDTQVCDLSTSTSYKRIDPNRSKALMACQLELELESMLENCNGTKGR